MPGEIGEFEEIGEIGVEIGKIGVGKVGEFEDPLNKNEREASGTKTRSQDIELPLKSCFGLDRHRKAGKATGRPFRLFIFERWA